MANSTVVAASNGQSPSAPRLMTDQPEVESVEKRSEWLAPFARLLLNPKEAAQALRISERLLWNKTKSREIPCIRIGKAVRYSPAALQKWIEQMSNEK